MLEILILHLENHFWEVISHYQDFNILFSTLKPNERLLWVILNDRVCVVINSEPLKGYQDLVYYTVHHPFNFSAVESNPNLIDELKQPICWKTFSISVYISVYISI